MSKLQNVRAYLTGEGISHVDIEFENGIITSISPAKEGDVSSLPEDAVVLPGFIDQHVHGAGGSDTMDATPEALACISQTLAKEGTVAFLATTMTQSPEAITRALENVRDSFAKCTGASPIGVHLEGPFISPRYIGAQPPEYVAVADTEVFDTYCRASGGKIRLVTVAPEEKGGNAFISHLSENGIKASVGHSAAGYAQIESAIASGLSCVTHTYNAQSPVHHRE